MADKPSRYFIEYESKKLVAAYLRKHGKDTQVDPGDCDATIDCESIESARLVAESLLRDGNGTSRIYERTDITECVTEFGTVYYEYECEFREDI